MESIIAAAEREHATNHIDVVEDRNGEWMHTSLGGRFWPLDPRPEDIHISDIANGHALDCRYNGQGRVSRFYSVAEHTYLGANYVLHDRKDPLVALAFLFHDAAEGLLKDLSRAVKHAVGPGYSTMEHNVQECILRKYDLLLVSEREAAYIKDIDRRLVPLEKAAIMKYSQPWAYDQFEPLPGVNIACFNPVEAKDRWLGCYMRLCVDAGREWERFELD